MSNTPTLVRRSQLGELLLAEGKLSREELEAALAYREERGLKLGQALVALHLVTQQDLATALRSQGRIHCLNLTPGLVELDVARLLPESMARQFVAVAVHRVAGRITVAMEDPSEEYDVAAIAVALGEPVFAVHADPERILDAVGRVYPRAAVAASTSADAPRFTLVRGPLPESGPDEAAELLVRAALREACTIGAESFHVECTERGAEMSFRVVGKRTSAALLALEWADACTRALLRLAGGTIDLDGESLAIEVATLESVLGPCTRVALRALGSNLRVEDLPLEAAEHAILDSWLTAESGLLLVVGSTRAHTSTLAGECAVRAASAGRRVYQSDASLVRAPGSVVVRRDPRRGIAEDLRMIAEQAPDVVEFGALAGSAAWNAAVDLARAGTLVVAHVEARDGSAALAAMLRNAEDPTGAAAVCLGTLAARSVRTTCEACHGVEADVASCTACSGTGCAGTATCAELLDLHGPLRTQLTRGLDADGIRAAAQTLGFTDLRTRARRLVDAGRTNAREIERAWKA